MEKFKLQPEIKEAWCQALRSGRYRQGGGQLHCSNGTHCCLGVLDKEQGRLADSSEAYLSEELIPMFVQNRLVDLNDDEGKSFGEIADWIEENL